MGWQIELAKLLNKGSKVAKVPKVRPEKIGSLGTRFSAWIQGTKLSSWIKAGAAGGVGYTIYHAWGSGISTIAEATGLPEDTVESILFACIGVMIAYIAAKLLFPDNGGGTTVVIDGRDPSVRKRSSDSTKKGGSQKRRG